MTAEIEFIKGEGTRYRSLLHRPDGVVVEFDGGSYNKVPDRVPHDIAHLIVEDELRLTCGVWGVLVAGGLFPQAHAVQGRRPPHASERARAVTRAAGDRLTQAEILTGAVCHVVREDLRPRGDAMKRAVATAGGPTRSPRRRSSAAVCACGRRRRPGPPSRPAERSAAAGSMRSTQRWQ